jgi:OsmC-like protein
MPVMPIEKVIYTATAHTTGGRDGGASRSRMQIKLPADLVIDAEVDLGTNAGSYLIQARFDVQLPGIDRETVQKLVDGAHRECPYSKATHGNIHVVTNVTDAAAAARVA